MSHAAAMDRMYCRQRYFYDFTRRYYLLGRDRLIARLNPPPGGYVLEIGCGTARNLVKAAQQYPHALFFGIDVSEQMLRTARHNIGRAGLTDRVMVARGSAEDFDPDALFGYGGVFDRIFFSYALSMIPDWRRAVLHAFTCLRPDGRLMAVDFGNQNGLPRWFRKLLTAWLRAFMVEHRAALPALFALAADKLGAEAYLTPLYRGYSWLFETRPGRGCPPASVGDREQLLSGRECAATAPASAFHHRFPSSRTSMERRARGKNDMSSPQ